MFNHIAYICFCSLLDMIPELFSETRETDVILGPVVQAGMEALKVREFDLN